MRRRGPACYFSYLAGGEVSEEEGEEGDGDAAGGCLRQGRMGRGAGVVQMGIWLLVMGFVIE